MYRFCLCFAVWALLRTTAHSCMTELRAVEPSVQKPSNLQPIFTFTLAIFICTFTPNHVTSLAILTCIKLPARWGKDLHENAEGQHDPDGGWEPGCH